MKKLNDETSNTIISFSFYKAKQPQQKCCLFFFFVKKTHILVSSKVITG